MKFGQRRMFLLCGLVRNDSFIGTIKEKMRPEGMKKRRTVGAPLY